MKASANKRKFEKKIVRKETRADQGCLQVEINQDRENHDKKSFPPDNLIRKKPKKLKKVQLPLRVATMSMMNEQDSLPIAAADPNGFVPGTIVTPGNTHDSHILEPLVEQVIEKVRKPEAIAADAAYKTPAITSYLFGNKIGRSRSSASSSRCKTYLCET